MSLTLYDKLRIIAIIVGTCGLLSGPVLESFGVPQTPATHLAAVAGFIVNFGTLVSKIISTPSAQVGATYAQIPLGSIPIVGSPTSTEAQVGVIDPASATVTPLQKGP